MKLTALSEVRADDNFRSEHGLSYWIESGTSRILFDTGASDLFIHNANRLGISPDGADLIVLSHGHFDHGDGLPFLEPNKLLCHPGCFVKRYRKGGSRNIGLVMNEDEIRKKFELHCSLEPLQITPDIWFLGEIPRRNDFEAISTPYVHVNGREDFIMDDTGLACVTGDGLVVVSGCAHSGICNMTDHAMGVTGISEVSAVIGGFHLKENDERTRRTIDYLKNLRVGRVMPSHCTREPALGAFHRAFGKNEVLAGQEFLF